MGPVAAGQQALALAGIWADGDHACWMSRDGSRLLRPLWSPLAVLERFLQAAWRDALCARGVAMSGRRRVPQAGRRWVLPRD